MIAKGCTQRLRLGLVVQLGGRAVGIHVVNVLRPQARRAQGTQDGFALAGAFGGSQVAGVAARAIANNLAPAASPPFACVLQIFQDQHPGALR